MMMSNNQRILNGHVGLLSPTVRGGSEAMSGGKTRSRLLNVSERRKERTTDLYYRQKLCRRGRQLVALAIVGLMLGCSSKVDQNDHTVRNEEVLRNIAQEDVSQPEPPLSKPELVLPDWATALNEQSTWTVTAWLSNMHAGNIEVTFKARLVSPDSLNAMVVVKVDLKLASKARYNPVTGPLAKRTAIHRGLDKFYRPEFLDADGEFVNVAVQGNADLAHGDPDGKTDSIQFSVPYSEPVHEFCLGTPLSRVWWYIDDAGKWSTAWGRQ